MIKLIYLDRYQKICAFYDIFLKFVLFFKLEFEKKMILKLN